MATRIAVPALKIDLPVVRGPSGYPYCNVAMYFPSLSQPREGGVTFLYAHARVGMFLPLLERSKINNGASLIGMTIRVWTSNDLVSTYKIVRVRRHVYTLDGAYTAKTEQLWVQTSEGPHGTRNKLIVVAKRIGSAAADHDAAHPTPHPEGLPLIESREAPRRTSAGLTISPDRPFLPARTSGLQPASVSPGVTALPRSVSCGARRRPRFAPRPGRSREW